MNKPQLSGFRSRNFDEKQKKKANEEFTGRLRGFEEQLNVVEANVPVALRSCEGKMLCIQDSLEELNRRVAAGFDQKNVDSEALSRELGDLQHKLDTALLEAHVFASGEYSNWLGKLGEGGLDLKSTVNLNIQTGLPLEERIEAIKQVLECGNTLANEMVLIAQPIYDTLRSLYDPKLPKKCRAIEFTSQKLADKQAPWPAIDALYTAMNNWKRQYGAKILVSMNYLKTSLAPMANLSSQNEVSQVVFGDNLPKILEYARKAQLLREAADVRVEKSELNLLDLIGFRDDVQSMLGMAKDVLSLLYSQLISEEAAIESLLPTQNYLWGSNPVLRGNLKKATEILSAPLDYNVNQTMANLPLYLSYIDQSIQTLAAYSERKELLLNYPTAEAAIEAQLKNKNLVLPRDLPFQTIFAQEYLWLYYSQRFSSFEFDKKNFVLTKKS